MSRWLDDQVWRAERMGREMWIYISHNNISYASILRMLDKILASGFEDNAWFCDFPKRNSHLRATFCKGLLPSSLWIKRLRNHPWNHVLMMMDEFMSHQKCFFAVLSWSWTGGLGKSKILNMTMWHLPFLNSTTRGLTHLNSKLIFLRCSSSSNQDEMRLTTLVEEMNIRFSPTKSSSYSQCLFVNFI